MKTIQIAPEISSAINAVNLPRVQSIARELAGYGLAIALPHIHEEDNVRSLPEDMVQYENNLSVSFLKRVDFETNRKGGFPVMWRYIGEEKNLVASAWCHDT